MTEKLTITPRKITNKQHIKILENSKIKLIKKTSNSIVFKNLLITPNMIKAI